MRISDWSSDVCSSDLVDRIGLADHCSTARGKTWSRLDQREFGPRRAQPVGERRIVGADQQGARKGARHHRQAVEPGLRSEEHTTEPQSQMRNPYGDSCLKKQTQILTSTSTLSINKQMTEQK